MPGLSSWCCSRCWRGEDLAPPTPICFGKAFNAAVDGDGEGDVIKGAAGAACREGRCDVRCIPCETARLSGDGWCVVNGGGVAATVGGTTALRGADA